MAAPNAGWSADCTGQLKTGDGLDWYPVTGADGDSRFRLACQALSAPRVAAATPVCTRLCQAFGLPQRSRTDHGVPGATTTLGRLSHLSAWWVRLGILPACIAPGKPPQNGRPARRHRPLQADTTRPPARTRRAHQRTCARCREEFNSQRPPEALDRRTPATGDAPAPRPRPHNLPPLEYPARFEGRSVSATGGSRWPHQWVNVSHVCLAASVGLEDIDAGLWHVDFGPLTRGRLLARQRRLAEAYGTLTRRR
jgi:putative transposase